MNLKRRVWYGGIAAGAVVALTVPFGLAFGQTEGGEPPSAGKPSITAKVEGEHFTLTTACPTGDGESPSVSPDFPVVVANQTMTGATYEGDASEPGSYTATFKCGGQDYSTHFTVNIPPADHQQPGHQQQPGDQHQQPGHQQPGGQHGQAPGSQHGSAAKPGKPGQPGSPGQSGQGGHGSSQMPVKPHGGASTGGGAMASTFVG